jgi:pimeloyl-ACP methyl ester carboxylesterase
MNGGSGGTVVLVHGLWFGPWWMWLLARRLRKAGFEPRRFRYRSRRRSLDEAAAELGRFLAGRESQQLVAHSLGGLVTLRALALQPGQPVRRVVLLGSPLRGSLAASRAAGLPGGRWLVGAPLPALQAGYAELPAHAEVGMIAGTRPLGLGWLVGGLGGPSDGTVAVRETLVDGLRGRCELPVTHTGLLFSRAVVRRAAAFLRSGHFDRAA